MNLSDEEMKAVQPDYIVLDEFHRCGAQEWGKGVQNFLKLYDNRPVLGLSATNVRYLDNQRDMADELFDGNVASFMTLGDAIIRGILNAPKYVLSVFSCRKSLLKYEERVKRTKSKATRDAAEEYLEKLRRALVKAYYEEHGDLKIPANYVVDGVWIARWLSEQKVRLNGKSVGRNGRLKTLTKEQEKKLLSLGIQKNVPQNEAIWKEQYEEAKKFHETNGNLNVPKTYLSENGKSIGRWLVAQRKYRKQGTLPEEKIVLLDVIGMVWSYDDAWESGFAYAEEYFHSYGNLLVKNDYVTSEGFRLGTWIRNQRAAYKGASRKNLTEEQKKRLDSIGFIADVYEYKWNFAYERVLAYFNVHDNVVFPRGYTVDGVDLQSWLTEQRRARKNRKLSETQMKKLDVFDTEKTRKRVQSSTSQRKKVVL